MSNNKKSEYHPLYALSSLGAGGISVAFWKLADATHQTAIVSALEVIFYIIAFALFLINLPLWIKALKNTDKFFGIQLPASQSLNNKPASPVVSTGWMALPASFVMLLNASFVILPAQLHFDIEKFAPIGFWFWLFVYITVFILGFQILYNTFAYTTSIKTFHFGLFLHPLAYGLVAIPGVSMADMLQANMATTALILGLTAFVVGGILGFLALIFIFQRFITYGFPEPDVAPTSILLMPSITIYTIFLLKLMHYMSHHGLHIAHIVVSVVVFAAIGTMGATTTLGLIVLYMYFREKIPFGPSWWSFVCPFVALSVLSSMTYQFGGHIKLFIMLSIFAITLVSFIYLYVSGLTIKHLKFLK